jgi:surfactin synthase thioesterase subunit
VNRAQDENYRRDGKRALELLKEPPAGATPMGLRDPIRRVTAAAAKIGYFAKPTFAVAERLVNRALRQVSLYIANVNQTREKALAIVHEYVTPETQIMIGHSLGSVVAYEACHQLNGPLPLLITLGSPLGLDTIVYQRTVPRPLPTPLW